MAELISMTYEQARAEHFKTLKNEAKRKMNYWATRVRRSRPNNLNDPAHIRAGEYAAEYNYYKDALEALEDNRFQYETGFVKGFESAQPKWISVEERLPGDPLDGVGDVVELLIDKGDVKEVLPGYYDHDEKDWVIYFGDPSGLYLSKYFSRWRVIKWRPFPEPPKE